MAVTEVAREGRYVLECSECRSSQNYTQDVGIVGDDLPDAANWTKSCKHIERFILDFEDAGTLRAEAGYHMNLSPLAAWLCRDMWNSWVIVTIGEMEPSGLMSVSYRYESEFYTESSGVLGKISPEDGRQSIRNMLWDSVTTTLLTRQPDCEKSGLRCPVRSHTDADEKLMRLSCASQTGINAQVASIVFENCCTYCYRKTMGQDANFGMAEVVQPRSNSSRPSDRGNSTPNPSLPVATRGGQRPQQGRTPASAGTTTTAPETPQRKAGQSMSEHLKDPNLPF